MSAGLFGLHRGLPLLGVGLALLGGLRLMHQFDHAARDVIILVDLGDVGHAGVDIFEHLLVLVVDLDV